MKSNSSLYEVYKDIHTNKITSIESLKDSYPNLYNRLMDSVYEYLSSSEVSNAIYKARYAYYGKAGKAKTDAIIQCDSFGEKSRYNNQDFTKIGLKDGDLVHNYFLYLMTEVKKKGKTKGMNFFSIIFKNKDLESWIPITLTSFENWIYDCGRTTRQTDSLDALINSDSDDGFTLGSLISDSTIKTPESIYESKAVYYDILNSLANESLNKHPEYFIALNWALMSSKNGRLESTELYNHFAELLMTNPSISEVAQHIIVETLASLSTLGLDIAKINCNIDLHLVIELLENIKAVSYSRSKEYLSTLKEDKDRKACLECASDKEKQAIASLSHWLEWGRRSFKKNKTVIAYDKLYPRYLTHRVSRKTNV